MKRVVLGLLSIAAAVFIILKCIGVNLGFIATLPVIDILLGALLLSVAVGAAIKLHWSVIPFPLAIIFMLFEKEIAAYAGIEGGNIINNWLVLLCALLLSIGLGLISSIFKKKKKFIHFEKHDNRGKTKESKFAAETKYIDCTDFNVFNYSVRFGAGEIYFENIENYTGGGVLNLNCEEGAIEVHVPSTWSIVTNIDSKLGATDIEASPTPDGPLLTINGNNKLGAIDISFS